MTPVLGHLHVLGSVQQGEASDAVSVVSCPEAGLFSSVAGNTCHAQAQYLQSVFVAAAPGLSVGDLAPSQLSLCLAAVSGLSAFKVPSSPELSAGLIALSCLSACEKPPSQLLVRRMVPSMLSAQLPRLNHSGCP